MLRNKKQQRERRKRIESANATKYREHNRDLAAKAKGYAVVPPADHPNPLVQLARAISPDGTGWSWAPLTPKEVRSKVRVLLSPALFTQHPNTVKLEEWLKAQPDFYAAVLTYPDGEKDTSPGSSTSWSDFMDLINERIAAPVPRRGEAVHWMQALPLDIVSANTYRMCLAVLFVRVQNDPAQSPRALNQLASLIGYPNPALAEFLGGLARSVERVQDGESIEQVLIDVAAEKGMSPEAIDPPIAPAA